jgi:ubiquinone biosynthesis monooxygenase Coq7
MDTRSFSPIDRLFGEIDKAIKVLTVTAHAVREAPAAPEGESLTEAERRLSARLMRVNHSGEVAAQALYQGQASTSRDPEIETALRLAAAEENDHLAWCELRLAELGGRTSALNPLWYAGSFALGAAAGALGRGWGLGFVEETERQVESHLQGHMQRLKPADERSRAILEQMMHDEMRHGAMAATLGATPLPWGLRMAMRLTSRLMTRGSYWL